MGRVGYNNSTNGHFTEVHKMGLVDLLILLLIAGICGAIGQAISGFSRGGCLVSIAIGFIGALLGVWLSRALGLPELFAVNIGGTNFPIIWSIIGSALFVAVISLLTRGRA
jgi:uncharacterized membrane protein YeaQ/YmgE (transglycosylase-associated protein family)